MRQTPEEVERLLRDRGHSLTPQRRAIVHFLGQQGGHVTPADVLEGITAEFPIASRATVYATLALLRDLGVLAEVPLPGGEVRYDTNDEPHQHFLCRSCGRLDDVPPSWLHVRLAPSARKRFAVDQLRVVAEGRCRECARAAPPRA